MARAFDAMAMATATATAGWQVTYHRICHSSTHTRYWAVGKIGGKGGVTYLSRLCRTTTTINTLYLRGRVLGTRAISLLGTCTMKQGTTDVGRQRGAPGLLKRPTTDDRRYVQSVLEKFCGRRLYLIVDQ